MCRNIRPLFNFDPPATDEEIHDAAVQFVRKVSGTRKPSGKNVFPFERAIEDIAAVTRKLVDSLETTAQPKNREAVIKTLTWFGELFTSGYVPPDATNWTDGDNNAGFHSRLVVMTPNPSQSIPAAQFFNKDDPEKKNYFDNMATIEWPDGPDGKKARYLSAVKTIVVPKGSKNPTLAKEFIKFVVEKNRFTEYIKAANGRWFPAFTDVAADPFWRAGHRGPKGQKDMHVPVATTIFLDRDNKVFEHYKHPAFSQVYDENIWGKAMARIAIDKWPADKAADEAIERMKAIFAGYK